MKNKKKQNLEALVACENIPLKSEEKRMLLQAKALIITANT